MFNVYSSRRVIVSGHSVGNLVLAASWKRWQPLGLDSNWMLSHNVPRDFVSIFLSELLRVSYRLHGSTKGKNQTSPSPPPPQKKIEKRELNCLMHKLWISFHQRMYSYLFFFLPTSQPSEDARLARRQRIVPREGCCMQKNSRSTYEKCKCKCKV